MFMMYIGAGGWAYFKVSGFDSLAAYSKAYDFVEVNSTFYTTPPIEMVRSWRQRVPDDLRIAWEMRGKVSDRMVNFLHDMGIIHCTDISRKMPVVDSDILYPRLF